MEKNSEVGGLNRLGYRKVHPQNWYQQIQEIAQPVGRKEAKMVREVSAQYLGKTDPGSVKGVIADCRAGGFYRAEPSGAGSVDWLVPQKSRTVLL